MDNDFEFIIGSPVDREKLICEIYYKKEIIAEISQETNELILEIYPSTKNEFWQLPLVHFQKAIEYGKNYLLGNSSQD